MRKWRVLSLIAIAGVFLNACKRSAADVAGGFRVPVETVAARWERVEDKISAVGTFEPNEMVEVKSEVAGRVASISFEEGAKVAEGDVLFVLDDAKWRAERDAAEARFKKARNNLERSRRLLEEKTISPQEFDDVEAEFKAANAELALTEKRLADATIRSPLNGYASWRRVSPGKYVEVGETLVTVVENDPMKIDFAVPERYLPQLRLGQNVNVRVAASGNQIFAGTVYFIDPIVDPSTRTVKIRAQIPNPDGELRAGQYANVELIVATRENAVVVPEHAIVPQIDKLTVFVVRDGVAHRREVRLGTRLPGKVEISEGVAAGEEVVVAGQQKLRDQIPVQVVPRGNSAS
jgi:membrane fusion protein (multidrug efflux system)